MNRLDGTTAALDPGELAIRATKAVAVRHPAAEVVNASRILGGQSSLTYAADLHTPSGGRRVVIKVAPPGLEPVRNRDVLRQARVLELLSEYPDIAVPQVLGTDAGAPPEVPPLFVMAFVEGEAFEPLLSPEPSNTADRLIQDRVFAAARMAAALHTVDVTDPRLVGERLIDLDSEVGRWAKAYDSMDDDLRFGDREVAEWLLRSIPASYSASVLHGDWRLGNMQCNDARIDAVIDWEIWSLGDPRLDLAWFLLCTDPEHPGRVRHHAGVPNRDAIVAAYQVASGRPVQDREWFDVLVRYKQAAVSGLIVKNNRRWPQPGVDADKMLTGMPRLLDAARRLLR